MSEPNSDLWSINPRRLMKWALPLLGIGLIVIPLSVNLNAIRSYYYVSQLGKGRSSSYPEEMLRSIGKQAIPALKSGLKNSNSKIRIDCIQIIRDMGPEAWQLVPSIIPLTEDPDPRVQTEARFTICRLRKPADIVEPLIRQWIQENKLDGDIRAIQTVINLPPEGLSKSIYLSFCVGILENSKNRSAYRRKLQDVASYGILNTVNKDKGEMTLEEKTVALKTLHKMTSSGVLRQQAQRLLIEISPPKK